MSRCNDDSLRLLLSPEETRTLRALLPAPAWHRRARALWLALLVVPLLVLITFGWIEALLGEAGQQLPDGFNTTLHQHGK